MISLRLGDVGKVSMCKRVLKHETSPNGDIPFYKISTFGGKTDVFINRDLYDKYRTRYPYPKQGEVLISAAGTVGKTVVYDGTPAYFQDSNIVWIANDEKLVLNKYLYYFYKTEPWRTTNGSTIKRIYNENLRDIQLSVPSIEDQQKIADILDSLDRKININNKINTELETLARDIYNYWFVQFDFPDANNRPYKTHGGRMSYDPTIKRDIPANWRVTTIDKVSEIIMGQSPKGESYNQQRKGVPLLNGPADYDSTGSLTERIFTTAPTRMCKKDDMVFCVRATIGNLTYAERDFCLGRGVAAVRPIRTDLSELIYYSLLNDIERFKIQAVGSVIVGITKDDLTGSNIIIPDDETLDAFHKAIYPIISTIRKNKLENRSLIDVRDWLLPMLMNGQAKVS